MLPISRLAPVDLKDQPGVKVTANSCKHEETEGGLTLICPHHTDRLQHICRHWFQFGCCIYVFRLTAHLFSPGPGLTQIWLKMSVDSDNSFVLLSSRDSRTSCIFQTADEKDDIPGVGEER